MAELPDELRGPDGARGLPLPEPLDHALRVARRRRGVGVGRRGGLDEEVAEGRERGGLLPGREGFVVADVAGLDERGADVEGVRLVQHRLDQALDGVLGGAEGPQPGHA